MSVNKISEAILGVGVDDTTIDLFESQYPVPTGVSYNSYVILDEKTAVLDTVDARATEPWLENLTEALAGRKPDYLVVSHMEPDHGANIAKLAALYPEMQVVGNAKTFLYMEQFFGADAIAKERRVVVKDGESLSLGAHTLTFVFAPMVHWPEVMVSYESTEKVLFSADGFGRFGAVAKFDEKADWASEARRYYLNIVGKYGPQVQALLKKAAALDIQTICPLHGPVLTGDLGKYLNYYDIWSSYKPEEPEKILVASASIHGHTRAAAHLMAEKLRAKGAKVVEMDLTRTDVSYAVTEAFRCGKIVLACATYDGFLFPPMENLLTHLKTKSFQNRTVGLMENGTWAPMAAKLMRAELEGMKNITVCDTDWASEARRYYLNIVGKYGPQVQALLKKAAALDIATICPLHGPVLTGDLGKYLAYYDTWSSYKPEEPEKILVASASIHGHTRAAAHTMAEKLRAKGAKVVEMDLTRTDVSYAVTEAFRCGKIVLACATYDGFLFPPMESLLTHLKTKAFQNRTVGLMENGTWAPMAAKLMRAELEGMKNITVCENVVTIRSAANAAAEAQMDALADEIVAK